MAELKRDLGPWAATSLVVGTVIGTGVFLKTAVMARSGGSAPWVLAAWLVGGLLSFAGALTYAELGARFPQTGGEYVYLREGYGRRTGYLYAFTRFWITTPASIAAYAIGTTTFLGRVFELHGIAAKLLGVGLIAAITAINCGRIVIGGGVQTVLTIMKVVMIVGLAVGALVFARAGDFGRLSAAGGGWPGWSAFGAMVLAALWAYSGFQYLSLTAGEIRDPERTLPRAIIFGMLAVLGIYGLVNLAYFYALPFSEVAGSSSVGQATAATFLGGGAQIVLALAMTISTLSAMNGCILMGARLPYAVSKDGLAPALLSRISARTNVPVPALIVQGVVGSIYALGGGFDQLTDAVVIVTWVFFMLNAVSVLRLRTKSPPTGYRLPGFPIVPLVFVALAILLIANSMWTAPGPAALGAGMTALAAVIYQVRYARSRG